MHLYKHRRLELSSVLLLPAGEVQAGAFTRLTVALEFPSNAVLRSAFRRRHVFSLTHVF